jgi:hypothetical protein
MQSERGKMVYTEWPACTGRSSDPRRKRQGDGEAVARDGAGDPWNRMGVIYVNHGIYAAPSLRYLGWSSARASGSWVGGGGGEERAQPGRLRRLNNGDRVG